MNNPINISKYDFHDGSIIDFIHLNDKIEISMESAEISDDELQDNIALSDHFTIKGILHLEGIKIFKVEGKILNKLFKKKGDIGDIYSFDIKKNVVKLFVQWVNYPPHLPIDDFSTIEIEAEKIWWENIPDLYDPYW